MLEAINRRMLSLLEESSRRNTKISANDFLEAHCPLRHNELIPCRWDQSGNRWVYEETCFECESIRNQEAFRRQRISESGLTEAETELTLDHFDFSQNAQAFNAAKRIASREKMNIFFHGPAGRGKTHLAIGSMLARGSLHKAKFFPVTKLFMTIRSNIKEGSEEGFFKQVLSNDLVVLDDVGANKLTDWNLSLMDSLIDEWYRLRRGGLIITSNFGPKEISERISDRIASRICQMCEVYEIVGKDHRLG